MTTKRNKANDIIPSFADRCPHVNDWSCGCQPQVEHALWIAGMGGKLPRIEVPNFGDLKGAARQKAFREWMRRVHEYWIALGDAAHEYSKRYPDWPPGNERVPLKVLRHTDWLQVAGWCELSRQPRGQRRRRRK